LSWKKGTPKATHSPTDHGSKLQFQAKPLIPIRFQVETNTGIGTLQFVIAGMENPNQLLRTEPYVQISRIQLFLATGTSVAGSLTQTLFAFGIIQSHFR